MFSVFESLAASMDESDQFAIEYDGILSGWLSQPVWSNAYFPSPRIYWKYAEIARKESHEIFNQPGILLFGASQIPRVFSATEDQTLWERLNGRFIGGNVSQCRLAERYEQALIAEGMQGFPRDVNQSNSRMEGAVDFARHGIHSVWFSLIPVDQPDRLKALKDNLIRAGNDWNIRHGYARLLNKQQAW